MSRVGQGRLGLLASFYTGDREGHDEVRRFAQSHSVVEPACLPPELRKISPGHLPMPSREKPSWNSQPRQIKCKRMKQLHQKSVWCSAEFTLCLAFVRSKNCRHEQSVVLPPRSKAHGPVERETHEPITRTFYG